MCDPYNDIKNENLGLWERILKSGLIPSIYFNSESESEVESAVESKNDEALYRSLALVYLFQKRYCSLKDKIFGIDREQKAELAKKLG